MKKKRLPGSARGQILDISSDFDETPADFEDPKTLDPECRRQSLIIKSDPVKMHDLDMLAEIADWGTVKRGTLALDLEGTLISNAVSAFPRPGLYDFLSFCREAFSRLVIFTSVPEATAKRILGILAAEGSAPAWFADMEVFVCERHMQKDLERIGQPGSVWLIDDQEAYILPGQKGQWIPVHEFMPPFTQADDELARVKSEILGKPARVFALTELESPSTPSIYRGKPLSLGDMERAVQTEAATHRPKPLDPARPQWKISVKAARQIKNTSVSPKLLAILEKAHSAQVTHVTGVGIQLTKLSRDARQQLATSVAPPEALALAAKAADIAKRSADQNQATNVDAGARQRQISLMREGIDLGTYGSAPCPRPDIQRSDRGKPGRVMRTITCRVEDEIEERLERLASETHHTKSSIVREALLKGLDDMEDVYLADQVSGEEETSTLAEVEKRLGLAPYKVGSRPPSTLSKKAIRQLQRAHVSPKLISIMEKAGSVLVTRVTGKVEKLGLTPKDVEGAVEWARRGERTGKSLFEALQPSQGEEEKGSMFGPTEEQIDSHPCNGKRGIWRVDGVRHSCLVSRVSTAREARDRAIVEGAVQEWELEGIAFLGELPEVFRF